MNKLVRFVATTIVVPLTLVGCAGTMRSYDGELQQTVSLVGAGNTTQALQQLEKNNPSKDKDLLYYFEKGQLLRLDGRFAESRDAWFAADEKIQAWEEAVKTDPAKFLGNVGSVVVNDKGRLYEGADYEKVLLTTMLALDHINLGDWANARTEIKKTHEREAVISELRAKQFEKEAEEAKKRNVTTTIKDLKGYPVETLDDPDVVALKNAYQSAISHYLAGFIYEALGEASLAAPGYRTAIELRPNIPLLEDGLKNLDRRRRPTPGLTDTLFVVESGFAPAKKSISIPIPVPLGGPIGLTPISFPIIQSDTSGAVPATLTIDDGKRALPLALVTNVDALARRQLRDEMPGIILRGTVRAVAKTAAQKVAYDRGGLMAGLLVTIATVATESADERVWRTLPSHISLGRAMLPVGEHTLTVPTKQGEQQIRFVVAGKHAVVPVRVVGGNVYVAQTRYSPEQLAAWTAPEAKPSTRAGTRMGYGTANGRSKKAKKNSAPAVKSATPIKVAKPS
ncbi:conserved hypothetical protein [Thiobacillus denitrificans ATCC 25259]|uniref:Lipoprotein n=1 Tax=Thiobacillus denitrificans (strain ATCC 25259 / T1) TaxID=292415 RepID=Q3SFY7_THIDA|nr:hypothetical protein [Thiobacillus denitrificans]AAZ98469.1 conserved hypothetical protein [Thiobacillus denitrificans ATCC 25259]